MPCRLSPFGREASEETDPVAEEDGEDGADTEELILVGAEEEEFDFSALEEEEEEEEEEEQGGEGEPDADSEFELEFEHQEVDEVPPEEGEEFDVEADVALVLLGYLSSQDVFGFG